MLAGFRGQCQVLKTIVAGFEFGWNDLLETDFPLEQERAANMLTPDQLRRRARHLLSMAVKAREAGDEETADQLVLWASELFRQATRQEGSRAAGAYQHAMPDAAQGWSDGGKSRGLYH